MSVCQRVERLRGGFRGLKADVQVQALGGGFRIGIPSQIVSCDICRLLESWCSVRSWEIAFLQWFVDAFCFFCHCTKIMCMARF